MSKPLRALVAIVIDEEQIAVNAGTKAGVNAGDRLYILRETDIPDPENPERSLGTAFVRKGTLNVETVDENFAVARVTKVSKNMLGPAEPTFTITDDPRNDGRGRVFIEAGDPVDILLTDQGSGWSL